MIQKQLVEHRALDLVSVGIFAAKDVTEKEAIASSATGGNDFAVFHNDIGLIDFLLDPMRSKVPRLGRRDSPILNRGNFSFSKIATFHPCFASKVPAALPAGPPPTITMSKNSAITYAQ